MATNFCERLYQLAGTNSGENLWISLGNERVLLIQSAELANRVLARDEEYFAKNLESLAQVAGASRVTENGDAWRALYRLSQPSLSNIDKNVMRKSVIAHATEAVGLLLEADQHSDKGLNELILLQMTASVMTDVLFTRSLSDFGPECVEDISRFASFVGMNSPYNGCWVGEDRPEDFRALGDLRLRWLKRMSSIENSVLPSDRLLYQLLKGTQGNDRPGRFEHEVLMLFGAGSETLATAISWAILLLAQYPQVQEYLRTEIRSLWRDGTVDGSVIAGSELMLRFIAELFRLHPPIPFLTRRSKIETMIDKFKVKPGTGIIVSNIGIGRDASRFNNPDLLDVNRELSVTCPNAATIPFGAGARQCGGQRMAMFELPVILAVFLRQIRFKSQHNSSLNLDWRLTMHCVGGVPVSAIRV